MTETVLSRIAAAIEDSARHDPNAVAAPVAVLWPDKARQWQPVVDALTERLPVIVLGRYDGTRSGPAYWIRCVLARTVEIESPPGVPVVYLPGIGREDLRAVEGCPMELAPIAELQYRGQWFSHPNGKDWTVRSFFSNKSRGFGLAVADDAATNAALLSSFRQLLDLPTAKLASRYLDAAYFNDLLSPDPDRCLLDFIDDPGGLRRRLTEEVWDAFVNQSRSEYDFDPTVEGELIAAMRLGEASGAWAKVWKRFREAPGEYPNLPDRLRQARPNQLFTKTEGSWPQDNEDAEEQLRKALSDTADLPPAEARARMKELWAGHRHRLNWVWADLGRAPLVFAVEQLVRLSEYTAPLPAADDVDGLVAYYTSEGWKADEAMLRAVSAVTSAGDRGAVAGAIIALYRSWLTETAKRLQAAVGPLVNAGTYRPGSPASTKPGTVTMFVDGLRLDLAHRLAHQLGLANCSAQVDTTLAALPTVTDNAKAVLAPVDARALVGGADLGPARASNGVKATTPVLRSLMADAGIQVLGNAEYGDPAGTAWTEAGEVDRRGHDDGLRLVDYLDDGVERIAARIRDLLDAGWQRVEVVTDHGWLLMPRGLPKAELPLAAVVVRKGRCARVKDGAQVNVPTVPWHWDPDVRIAIAPGITCFEAGKEYEHGGVSLQECVVPRLTVTAGRIGQAAGPVITKVRWLGLVCRVEFAGVAAGSLIDIRAFPADPSTSVAENVKETSSEGKASLLVPDEDLEGERAYVVIVGSEGRLLAQREVTIGTNR